MARTTNIFPKRGNILQQISTMLKVFWLYASNIILITVFALAFLNLSQGSDVLVKTSENTRWFPGVFVMLALFFWVYVTWYSSRIISYLETDLMNLSPGLLYHMPRLMGFYIYALFIIAFLNKPDLLQAKLNGFVIFLLLIGYGIVYWQLNLWIRIGSVTYRKKYGTHKFSRLCSVVFWLNLAVIAGFGIVRESNFSMIIGATLLQFMFIFLVVNRRHIGDIWIAGNILGIFENVLGRMFARAQGKIPGFEEFTFAIFNLISLIALFIYCLAIFWLPFSIQLGTLGVVLLALGFYTGLFNLIKMFSLMYRVKIAFFLLVPMFIGGLLFESHKVAIIPLKHESYTQRQDLKVYFYNWLQQHEAELNNDSLQMVPLIFAHADGGASRSGYWTASVLGKLDSTTDTRFSRHLFALSGASGGSVGNATFFSLLYLRQFNKAYADSITRSGIVQPARDFLKTDFLTYTLARMLGPDIFNSIYPFVADRARALEYAMEQGAGNKVLLNGFFSLPFSHFVTTSNTSYPLPILCINTTRMQDGMPGVISNIQIDTAIFGRRLDVLSLLQPDEDMRLSTAVVMGARFPYISPAGCITRKEQVADGSIHTARYYFVDGGYFDNSGAGVVHEMIMELNNLVHNDTLLQKRYGSKLAKLRFMVVHITNTPYAATTFKKAFPFSNDLAAPLLTLAGSYSSQTSVNNSRLEKYMQTLYYKDSVSLHYGLPKLYYEMNLYSNDSEETYSMNWSISDATLKRMQNRLNNNYKLDSLINQINRITK
jgi:hypothetical protein